MRDQWETGNPMAVLSFLRNHRGKEHDLRAEAKGVRRLLPVRNVCEYVGDALVVPA